jgi:site-specific DNA-methyltransferase (adenine-specific)
MKPIYQDWIYKFTKLSTLLLFITPSKWFTSQDKLLVELRNYMKNLKIEFIKHFPNDDVFRNVKVKGGVSYYLINESFDGITKFNDKEIDINKYDIILEPKYYKLVNIMNEYFKNSLSNIYCSQGTFLNSKTEKELTCKKKGILCYVSKNKGLKKYILNNKVKKDYNYWKVITPAAAFKGPSGFSDIYLLNNKEIHSRSYISFKINDKKEAKSLYSYMHCKLPQLLLSLRKQTHNLCNSNVFKWIPYIPLDREWNNKKLYKYFKLDKEIINFIENIELEGKYK